MATKIRAIAFDLEGTIINLEFLHHEAHILAARDAGLALTAEECFEKIPHFIGGPDNAIAEEIAGLAGGADPAVVLARDQFHYRELLAKSPIVPRPGFLEFAEQARTCGMEIAIGSATEQSVAMFYIKKSGLDALFPEKNIVLGEAVLRPKPAPDVYEETARRMGVQASEQLVFDDSPRGVLAAAAAGSPAVAMPVYGQPKIIADLIDAGAVRVFMDWREINLKGLLANFSLNDHQKFIRAYADESRGIIDALVAGQSREIDAIIAMLWDAWQNDRPVYIMGNGGSASSASHFAADLSKTINDGAGKRGIRALTPWDNIPLVSAIVNDRPKEDIFSAWLDTHYQKGGIGIGISVHGGSGTDLGGKWSQNILAGLQYIKDRGGKTVGFSGYDGGPMKNMADACVVVPVKNPAIGTAVVESFHVLLQHLIVFRLKELIAGRGGYGAAAPLP